MTNFSIYACWYTVHCFFFFFFLQAKRAMAVVFYAMTEFLLYHCCYRVHLKKRKEPWDSFVSTVLSVSASEIVSVAVAPQSMQAALEGKYILVFL